MSAGFAHMTLVNELAVSDVLDNAGVPAQVAEAVLGWFKFCELGAVSPDYPYLKIEDSGAQRWADDMHKMRAGEMIHAGVLLLSEKSGEAWQKGITWLLGYAAHVYTDLTIHPVVNMKAGSPYEQHKKAHRVCEMHQDVYVYQRLNLGPMEFAEHLDSGIRRCGNGELDSDIIGLWAGMLERVYADHYAKKKPQISEWHRRFIGVIDDIAEEGGSLMPLARHVATGQGLVYPSIDKLNMSYITNLETPAGIKNYDEIFDHAKKVVLDVWTAISDAAVKKDQSLIVSIDGNVNLDEGTGNTNQLVAWG